MNQVIATLAEVSKLNDEFMKFAFGKRIRVVAQINKSGKQNVCCIQPFAVFKIVCEDANDLAVCRISQ